MTALGVMQPYLFPYLGYWQLIAAVDEYVVFDDVNYITRGWINRNRLRLNGEPRAFTIRLSGASQNRLINEIEIGDDFSKLRKTLHHAYASAPHYADVMPLLETIFAHEDRNLARFAMNALRQCASHLGIETPMLFSSDIDKDGSLRGQEKILAICQARGATRYINAIGGRALYDPDAFAARGVELRFLQGQLPDYGPVVLPGLSIIDVMMWSAPQAIRGMLDAYDLV